jgi:hypothetical protein
MEFQHQSKVFESSIYTADFSKFKTSKAKKISRKDRINVTSNKRNFE